MSIPEISEECIQAVKQKAAQATPWSYAKTFVEDTVDHNPHLVKEMKSLCQMMFPDSSSLTMGMAYMGVFYNCIKAQIEGEELDELFKSSEAEG